MRISLSPFLLALCVIPFALLAPFLLADGTGRTGAERDAELLAAANDEAIVAAGKDTYTGLCFACHGATTATGDSPSNLFDGKWYHGAQPSEIEHTILTGVLEKGMPGWGEILPAEDITAVAAFIISQQPK